MVGARAISVRSSIIFGIGVIATLCAIDCGPRNYAPTDTIDAAVPGTFAHPCWLGQVVSLRYFIVPLGVCTSTYDEAIGALTCQDVMAECTGYHVIGSHSPYVTWDCFYDVNSGELAGADYSDDQGQDCSAAVSGSSCGTLVFASGASCTADGGAP